MIKQLINAAFVVIIPRISRGIVKDKEKTAGKLSEILNITLLITIPAASGLFMVRRSLILLFAGSEYIQAEASLAILAIALIPALLANFFINIVLIPLGKEKNVMIATVTSAIINVLLNFILIPLYAERGAAFTTLLAELTMTIMGIYYSKNMKFKKMKKAFTVSIISALIIIGICLVVNHNIENYFISLVMCLILSVAAYGCIVLVCYREKVLKLIKRG